MKLFLIILLFFPFLAVSQTPNWEAVNIEPTIKIKEIVSDSLGFLWLNDDTSLYRFDGIKATVKFKIEDEKITSLEYSKTNQIILGTHSGRVYSINPYNGKIDILHKSESSITVTKTKYFDNSNFIILYYGFGIGLMTNGYYKEYNIDNGLLSNEVYDVVKYNNQYFISTDQGIQILSQNHGEVQFKSLTIDDGLSDIVITHLSVYNDILWYSDYNKNLGQITLDGSIHNYKLPTDRKINSIVTDESGIYLTTDKGLLLFKEGSFQNIFNLKDNEKINIAQIDEEGNLWLFTDNSELYKGNLYFQKMQLKLSNIRAIENYKNQIIVGNETGIFQPDNNKIYNRVTSDNVTHMKAIGDFILVGTFSEGIKVYDKKFNLVQEIDQWSTIKNESILHIFNHENEVFVSSLSGVMQFNFLTGKLTPKESINSKIGQGYIYSMLTSGDEMFFGTDRDGLFIWDRVKDELVVHETFHNKEKIGSVYALTKDKNGKIWFTSTEHGIGYLKNEKPFILSNISNKKDEYTSLKFMDKGCLLAIRGRSIDIFHPISQHFLHFDNELGLKNEITYLNNIVIDGKQTYFIHDQNLFRYIYNDKTKIYPEVIIDQIKVNLSPVNGNNDFEQNENNIEFDFKGSWLTDPLKLIYQYKLEGFEEEWRTTKDNSVAFPKLRPGKYKFILRASESGIFNKEPEAEYSFQIHMHFYNKWWVRFLILGLIGFIIFSLIKQRETRKKEKLALEKLNIENQFVNLKNQLNPHFLFNAFNTLIGLIEEDSDRSVDFVEKMTDFYRNILELGKENTISLSEEKEMLSQYIDILNARFKNQLNIEMLFSTDIECYEIPPMTLQLLVENAVKHNVVSTKNPLHITIIQTESIIAVKNKKSYLINTSIGTKTGLENIKRRFELVKLNAPIINNSDNYFEVIINLKKQ